MISSKVKAHCSCCLVDKQRIPPHPVKDLMIGAGLSLCAMQIHWYTSQRVLYRQ